MPQSESERIGQLFDNIRGTCVDCYHPACMSTVKAAKAEIAQMLREARYDELTKLGRLYNGSKHAFVDHYESRYKSLKQSNSTGLDQDG